MNIAEDTDLEGRRPSDFIGRRTRDPAGTVVDACVDASSAMLLDIKSWSGRILEKTPLSIIEFEDD